MLDKKIGNLPYFRHSRPKLSQFNNYDIRLKILEKYVYMYFAICLHVFFRKFFLRRTWWAHSINFEASRLYPSILVHVFFCYWRDFDMSLDIRRSDGGGTGAVSYVWVTYMLVFLTWHYWKHLKKYSTGKSRSKLVEPIRNEQFRKQFGNIILHCSFLLSLRSSVFHSWYQYGVTSNINSCTYG